MANQVDLSMVLDGVIVLLLVATIGYAVVLNRRIGELRKWRAEFGRLIQAFNQAATRAEAGIQSMRSVADQRAPDLPHNLDHVQALRDDLAFLVERGNTLADSLTEKVQSSIRSSRPDSAAARPTAAANATSDAGAAARPGPVQRAGRIDTPSAQSRVTRGPPRTKTKQALLKAIQDLR